MVLKLEYNSPNINYPAFRQLNELCFTNEPVSEWSFQRFLAADFWCLYHGDVLVGFGGCSLGEQRAHIRRIAVHPAYRSRGLGSRLMAAMVAQALELGLERITLMVQQGNEPALRLYRKFGFSVSGESVQFIVTVGTAPGGDLSALLISEYHPQADGSLHQDLLTRLARAHDPPNRYALVFLRERDLAGCACFSPDFPGCNLFEVFTDSVNIQPLVDLLEPYTQADKRMIRITTGDHIAIDLFRSVGTRENYRMYEMTREMR